MTALTAPGIAARRRPGLALALLAFAQLIVSIDYNIVYVALPEIGSALGFSAQSLQWVISTYAVAFGGFLLLAGGGAAIVAVTLSPAAPPPPSPAASRPPSPSLASPSPPSSPSGSAALAESPVTAPSPDGAFAVPAVHGMGGRISQRAARAAA
ncbi:hypothetical protein ABZ470_33390 [Streptosporangium sp. NPDC020072]|uniref:hypothetical protein n=1 Tax=Streptosporangium sp. NPDC020072 TaxID=3154788 RepID=UPI00342C12BE